MECQENLLSAIREMRRQLPRKKSARKTRQIQGRRRWMSDKEYFAAMLAVQQSVNVHAITASQPLSKRDEVTRNVFLLFRELSCFRRSVRNATYYEDQ